VDRGTFRRRTSVGNDSRRRTNDRRLCQPTPDETTRLQDLCQSFHHRQCQSPV